MTSGEEIQTQIFENLLEREGKTLSLTRRVAGEDVTVELEALINTNGIENERSQVDFANREHVEIWVWNDAVSPMVKSQETLTGDDKSYRVQKVFPGPIKTALICKVTEASA